MAKEYKKVSVFIDTNILQSFIKYSKKDYVFLANLGIPKNYYNLVSFIEENRLQDYVEICISEVVFKELRQHMIDNFNSFHEVVSAEMESCAKVAGDLLELSYKIKLKKEDYPEYVDKLIQEFIDNPQNMCTYIPISSKEELIDTLLDKSLRKVRPFVSQTIAGKGYKDAGFKDSIIAETMYTHCASQDKKCLFISNDDDFGERFEPVLNETNKYVRATTIDQAVLFLKDYYDTSVESRLIREFTENTYWHEYLLRDIGQDYDASVTDVRIGNVKKYEDNEYNIDLTIVVNESEYWFTINFDAVANDIIEYKYEIQND